MSLFFSSGKKAGTSEVFSPPSPPEYDLNSTMVDPIFDYQFRVILIGDSTVGKSSLLRHFTDGTFAEVSDPTVGVDFFARLLRVRDGTTIKLQLWDTAGQVFAFHDLFGHLNLTPIVNWPFFNEAVRMTVFTAFVLLYYGDSTNEAGPGV